MPFSACGRCPCRGCRPLRADDFRSPAEHVEQIGLAGPGRFQEQGVVVAWRAHLFRAGRFSSQTTMPPWMITRSLALGVIESTSLSSSDARSAGQTCRSSFLISPRTSPLGRSPALVSLGLAESASPPRRSAPSARTAGDVAADGRPPELAAAGRAAAEAEHRGDGERYRRGGGDESSHGGSVLDMSLLWSGRRDSNPHGVARTGDARVLQARAPRVCQFRHAPSYLPPRHARAALRHPLDRVPRGAS